jgi:hypothetical protein
MPDLTRSCEVISKIPIKFQLNSKNSDWKILIRTPGFLMVSRLSYSGTDQHLYDSIKVTLHITAGE